MIKILIVDNHLLVREGFKKIISEEIDLTVVGECQNAATAFDFVQKHECDVIVLDIDMPGRSGLDLLLDLQNLAPHTKVLMQSIFPEEEIAVRAFKMGAAGYISKEAAADELVAAIRKVYAGGRYVSGALAEKLAFDLGKSESLSHERLSDREFQVLQLISTGKSPSEIAEILSLSANTVNTYRKRILEKLELSSTAELIHYAMRHKLVP